MTILKCDETFSFRWVESSLPARCVPSYPPPYVGAAAVWSPPPSIMKSPAHHRTPSKDHVKSIPSPQKAAAARGPASCWNNSCFCRSCCIDSLQTPAVHPHSRVMPFCIERTHTTIEPWQQTRLLVGSPSPSPY